MPPSPKPRQQRSPVATRAAAALLVVCIGVACGWAALGLIQAPRASAGEQSAPRIIHTSFWSDALGREMPYSIYLPPGYESTPDRAYPVVYLLHGLGGNHTQWAKLGLFAAATELMRHGDVRPFIIVTPEGERGYWIDHAAGGPRFGTYIAQDLVSTIDREYRTVPARDSRAIGGISMGAHGALQLALNNPAMFGVVGAHSLVLRDQDHAFSFFGDKAHFEAHDPVSLTRKNRAAPRRLKLWIDIGKNDSWYVAAQTFHAQLQEAKVAHAWRAYSGGHDDAYWRAHVRDYLLFYGRSLRFPPVVRSSPVEAAQPARSLPSPRLP